MQYPSIQMPNSCLGLRHRNGWDGTSRRRATRRRWLRAAAILPFLSGVGAASPAQRVVTLRSTGGLPAHVAARFQEPLTFQQARSGTYYVLDRRAHAVFRIDEPFTEAQLVVDIGNEEGRVLEPSALAVEPGGSFVVADAPNMVERVQIFGPAGTRIGGFRLPGRATPRIVSGSATLSGVGSIQYTGRSILISQPETGGLITEYSLSGAALRTIGALRATGQEQDRDLHLALNSGIPLVGPDGGFYFVFQAGVPMFQQYDRTGRLIFERHIEGRELDGMLQALPTTWKRRRVGSEELPVVLPTVRTAAVDPKGRLWVSFVVPFTYVYDTDGEKVRTIRFRGAQLLSPSSLFFPDPDRVLVAPGCYEFAVD